MGKGKIVENLGSGRYRVQILYGSLAAYEARITEIDAQIADLIQKIADETDPVQKEIYKLQKSSLEKQRQELQIAFAEPVLDTWCVEFIEDFAIDQEIATIEIPGERQQFNIRPGFSDQAVWVQARDGQLHPAIMYDRWSSLYGQMILPGWQKWYPNYRIGQIVSLDQATNTCQVSILPAQSSQQNLNVNQEGGTILGGSETHYQETAVGHPGWTKFKIDYPSHPLVTNTEQPQKLASNDALIDQIWAIHIDVRSKHLYESDASYRAIGDDWQIMAGDDPRPINNDRGDCEDFALTFADKLISQLGISPRSLQIALCFTQTGSYHANLLIPTTNHGTLCLDINTIGRDTKEAIDQTGFYRWDKFLINGDTWAIDSREAYTVAIEYMNCGASVFEVGDNVVVEFLDMNWNQPKVIGFVDNPRECGVWFYRLFGSWIPDTRGNTNFAVNLISKTTQFNIPMSGTDHRVDAGAAVINNSILIFGGWGNWWDPNKPGSSKWSTERHGNVDLFTNGIYAAKTALPGVKRSGIAGFELNGKIYAIGGWDYHTDTGPRTNHWFNRLNDNYQYSLDTDIWINKVNIPINCSLARGLNVNDQAFVFGSVYTVHRSEPPVEQASPVLSDTKKNYQYNDISDAWIQRKSMIDAQANFGGQMALESGAYILGNACYSNHPEFDSPSSFDNVGGCSSLQRYNPATDSWSYRKNSDDFSFRARLYDPVHETYFNFDSEMSGSVGIANCVGYEDKGYINPRLSGGTDGVVEYDAPTDSYSIFIHKEEVSAPAGNLNYNQGSIAAIV